MKQPLKDIFETLALVAIVIALAYLGSTLVRRTPSHEPVSMDQQIEAMNTAKTNR